MKVLMISGDPAIFDEHREACARMKDYASLVEELHIVVVADVPANTAEKISSGNLFLYASGGNLLFRFFNAYRLIVRLCGAIGFQLISAQGPDEFGILGWLASRARGIPLQLQVHTDILSPWYRRASLKEWLRYRIALFLIPKASCLRVVSERIRRSINSIFNIQHSKIAVLPIFTDISDFLNSKKNSAIESRFLDYAPKLIAAGRFMDKEKNFSLLIDCMPEIIKMHPKALLLLLGAGPDERLYRDKIRRKKLESHIIIEPWRDDFSSFIKSFDLLCMPSFYEGWGRTAVEALSAGIPVLMTDVGLAGELVKNGENGQVIDINDRDTIGARINDLFQNRAKYDTLREGAEKTRAELLSQTREKYLAAYRETLIRCGD